jgi:hypothetical protein
MQVHVRRIFGALFLYIAEEKEEGSFPKISNQE